MKKPQPPLTAREAEILEIVRRSKTITEAARTLNISRQRVSAVIARCRAKGMRQE